MTTITQDGAAKAGLAVAERDAQAVDGADLAMTSPMAGQGAALHLLAAEMCALAAIMPGLAPATPLRAADEADFDNMPV